MMPPISTSCPSLTGNIHIHLDGQIEKAVQQYRTVIRNLHGIDHVLPQIVFIEHYFHSPAAEDVARPHHQGEPHVARQEHRRIRGACQRVGGLFELEGRDQLLEPFAILGDIDAVGRRAYDGRAGAASNPRDSFNGVWPPNCTITPSGFSFSMISMTSSNVRGSKYKRSEVS